ncbi:LIM domain only protein 7-like isoform X2 [Liolophura sinensis]|uniref:LIM domain only protein 7-like isoform X2 n=1 Tax=Liolophura sinensis TaxID=3198878 RepID=UPI003158E600
MASTQSEDEAEWIPRFRIDEELDFFTDLALQETERWLKAVTKKKLSHPDDLRRSLQNGVLLCELVNGLKPGSITRINKLSTPIAGLDNLTVFLRACQEHFGLRQPQLFDPLDLEDLSQRAAFADDDPCYLKQETDRRLRNVALTVYWLGQAARNVYIGPQLDQSAFSGLVAQNPGVLSPDQSPQRSWNSYNGGSPCRVTSFHSDNSDHYPHSVSLPDEHAPSEESYGSEGGSSLENELRADMYRHNSSSNLNRWGNSGGSRGSFESSSVYSNHDSAMYRSSPNLSQGSHSHTRSSSTDSLDGGHGFHSRHSSGSGESYATRRVSGSGRPSVSANPLQFVKTPGASHLAQAAQEQIKIAEESKKIKWDTLQETIEDNDWQSKLGSWKSKRRSQSAASYERKEEAEAQGKEQEEKALRATKTFSEIVKEREKRKSMNSYPIEEDNEDYGTTNNNQSNDINHNQTERRRAREITGSFDDSAVFEPAPWAASSDDDTDKNSSQMDTRLGNGVPSESDTESNKENWTENSDSHNNNNNIEEVSNKYNGTSTNSNKTAPTTQRSVGSKLSSIRKAFEEQVESDNEYKPLSRRPARNYSVQNNQSNVQAEEPKVSPRSPRSDRDFVEKTITISQKPNSEKGFGFNFSGGRDKGQPIVVERVSLGGAADVCEVRVKDEITEINRRKVSTYSHTQVQDLIKRAVRTGKLELKVKRYIRKGAHHSDEFSEEDSFDRFEEKLEREEENLRNKSSTFTPMIDSLLRENPEVNSDRRASWEEEEVEHNDTEMDQVETSNSQKPEQEDEQIRPSDNYEIQSSRYNEPEDTRQDSAEEAEESESHATPAESRYRESHLEETVPAQQVEEEVEEPVLRRQLRPQRDTSKPLYPTPYRSDTLEFTPASVIQAEPGKPISFDISVPASSDASPSDGSGIGPPKALLRWQRRPQSQYGKETEETKEQPKPEIMAQFSRPAQGEVTRQSLSQEKIEQEIRPTVTPRTRLDLSREIKKMEEWDRQQEEQRQQKQTSSPEMSVTNGEKQFEQNVKAINSRWETDKQQAERRRQEKYNDEQVLLEQERKRVDAMEERRSERRAQRQAQMAQQVQQINQTPQNTEMVIQLPSNSGFQIDPMNKPDLTLDTNDGFQEVNFRVNMNQQSSAPAFPSSSSASIERKRQADLEEERLRILQEEQEMRRRLEEQKEAEDRRLREREEQLRRQEERLRQEEERLRQEQERLQKERQQHLQELNSPRGSSPASVPKPSPSYASSSPATVSPVRNTQPDQQFSSTVVIANPAPNNYYVKGVEHSVPFQSPFYNSANNKNDSAKSSQRLTREDLLAMSRSARPLEEKPPSLQQPDSPDASSDAPKTPLSPTSPIIREPPSRQEKHSLNAVPKPKIHDSTVWIGNAKEPLQMTTTSARADVTAPKPARRSDIMRKQYSSPQDHWLVQEAERRRLEEQNKGQRSGGRQGQYKTGPIKPHDSLVTNRWREKSPQFKPSRSQPNLRASTSFEQMRQKFTETPSESNFRPSNPALQPRAAPRNFSNGPHHTRGDSAPVSRQSHNSANSNYLGGNSARSGELSRASPKPAPRSRTSPAMSANSPEPTMAISGRQRCSHCQEELGYGAAMVIESLNLHYHMQCFRCCVCHAQLGNGAEGADVRVRGWKLHCRNCYSNDEAGLKFSKV